MNMALDDEDDDDDMESMYDKFSEGLTRDHSNLEAAADDTSRQAELVQTYCH